MKKNGIFKGRTISVVNDLSIDEQIYLYQKTKALKEAIRNKTNLDSFKLNDPMLGIYLVFLEDSTRTKESFRNAALFHNVKLNLFDAQYSSFNKMESYADTFSMLCGYSEYSLFIVRSRLEGVCRWLEKAMANYAERNHVLQPAFINAGDGKHEHPTQEFLDEYSFYEHKKWNRDHIHIALIGDLFHGRTTHSKADGLRIFKNVEIDLIAPEELAMPRQYVEKMLANGFHVKTFSSLVEYFNQPKLADVWYFTRLQLERMGEDIKEKTPQLIEAVTFKKDYMTKLSAGTKFYHPLPRNKQQPTMPHFLDDTSFNGWELQSKNGYYTRIIEIGMLGGCLGEDFEGESLVIDDRNEDFVEEIKPEFRTEKKAEFKVGIIPITNGLVIDHIGRGDNTEAIWEHIGIIRKMLKLNFVGSQGVFQSERTKLYKGIIAIPDITEFDRKNLKKLAAIAPGCTLNLIRNKHINYKFRLHTPPRVYNIEEISCKNPDCISNPAHGENAMTIFYRTESNTFACGYCEFPHTFKQIWNM
jgi:aspartate carbamoyltransferase